jgi:hypothetical protein
VVTLASSAPRAVFRPAAGFDGRAHVRGPRDRCRAGVMPVEDADGVVVSTTSGTSASGSRSRHQAAPAGGASARAPSMNSDITGVSASYRRSSRPASCRGDEAGAAPIPRHGRSARDTGAPAGDHVELARQNRARQHACAAINNPARAPRRDFTKLKRRASGFRPDARRVRVPDDLGTHAVPDRWSSRHRTVGDVPEANPDCWVLRQRQRECDRASHRHRANSAQPSNIAGEFWRWSHPDRRSHRRSHASAAMFS